MNVMGLLVAALTAVYPLLVYFGLRRFEPRFLALLFLVVACARWRGGRRTLAGLGWEGCLALAVPLALAVATGISNNEVVLRLYPVAVSIALLIAFSATLFGKESMIERIARARKQDLDEAEVRYTRKVTEVWCAFFAVNSAVTAWTAVRASRETWAFYNGFLVYFIIAALIGGEWLCRRRFMSRKDRKGHESR